MSQDWSTIILIGRSGSGKGTQADLLEKYLVEKAPGRLARLEMGARFREFIKIDSWTGELAREVNATGGRQPNFMAVWMFGNFFTEQKEPLEHLMIDGSPRSRPEAEMLDTAFTFYKRTKPTVLYLKASLECVAERLRLRGRADDQNFEQIKNRSDWFDNDVIPAIDWYRTAAGYQFVEIDGEQTVEAVHQSIIANL